MTTVKISMSKMQLDKFVLFIHRSARESTKKEEMDMCLFSDIRTRQLKKHGEYKILENKKIIIKKELM